MSNDKIIRLFPLLHNIKPFINRNHPEYHPDTKDYENYWEEQEKRCVEGFWGLDQNENTKEGGWRYCTPQLYYYINFCVIEDEDEENNSSLVKNPDLRDIEWMFFYAWLICRGFSGFDGDEEYTCNLLVKKLESGSLLTAKDKLRLQTMKYVLRRDGSYKKYIDPKEYLEQTFSKPLGLPIYGNNAKNIFVLTSRGTGKALLPEELVLSNKGWKQIQDLHIGDSVYGSDGKLTKVINKTDLQKNLNFYNITLNDGRTIDACEDHNWKVWSKNSNRNNKDIWEIKTTKELLKIYKQKRWSSKSNKYLYENMCAIPLNKSIEYKEKELPIDPYLLGLWLGDGSSNRVGITSADKEIVDYIYKTAVENNCKITINQNTTKTCPTYFITEGNIGYRNRKLHDKFKNLNLFNNKHIPELYLNSSTKQRLELLKGLMDSDGTSSDNNCEYYSKSKQLAHDVYNLSLSLGFYTTIKIKDSKLNGNSYGESYRVKITTNKEIFKLSRKLKNQKVINKNKSFSSRYEKVYINNIESIGKKDGICIEVDNSDNTYITKNYIVTHNSFWEMGIISWYFKFNGSTRYDDTYFNITKGPEIVVGAALASKSTDLLNKFTFNEEYQKNNFGSWGQDDDFIPGYFYNNTLGSLAVSNKSAYRREYITTIGGVTKTEGTRTKIYHITYMDNPNAAVGKRPIILIVEEVGLEGNLFKVHAANETCFIRRNKTGTAGYFGTGGDMDKILEPKAIFEDPDAYDMLSFKDVYENRKKPIGFFLPSYYTDNSFRDINGNQNIELAYEEEMHQRKIRASADNSFALDGYMMARPLVPSEMFLSSTANTFPTAMLRDRLTEVEVKKIFEIESFKGELEWTDDDKKEVRFRLDLGNKLKPIIQTNLDQYKGNLKGSIVFYESPEEDIPDPTRKTSLYKVTYDPIKDDGKGTSLASILVHKGVANDWATGLVDDIVCEFIGRTDLVEDIHDIALKIATYYNAKIMVETNIPDFVRYCRRGNKLHMLAGKPTDAISKAVKNPGKKYDVGIDMSSPALHQHAEQLIRQWLLTPWKLNNDGIQLLNLHKLKSPRLLLELIQYNKDQNFDHVSSFKLLHLWLSQDKQIPVEKASVAARDTLNSFYNQLKKNTNNSNPYHNY